MPKIQTQDIIQLISDTFKIDISTITPDTRIDNLAINYHIERVLLQMAIKDNLGLYIPPEHFEGYFTVQHIINAIEQHAVEQHSNLNSNEHHVHYTIPKIQKQDIIQLISDTLQIDISTITPDTLIDNLAINYHIERALLQSAIKDNLGLYIPFERFEECFTVQHIIDSIEQHAVEQHIDL